MKFIVFALALTCMSQARAQSAADCKEAARQAAEINYGLDPMRTEVKRLTEDTYQVTVGIGNAESGAHTYRVTFEGPTCDAKSAVVCDKTQPDSNDPRLCR